jgi:RNA recognition motif-containing protein
MDLRQFTTTPNNFDDQRRASISSTSTGYASSAYGGVNNNPNVNTPNSARLTQSRYFGQVAPPPGFQSGHNGAPNNGNGPSGSNSNWLQQGVLNVTPWIEQQQEVSNNTSVENQNFVNSYGHNLNSTFTGGNNVNASNQSIQATYDSRSTRASPSLSTDKRMVGSNKNKDDDNQLKRDNVQNNDNDNATNDDDDKHRTTKNNDDLDNDNDNDNDGDADDDDDDELIPTAIVIKNIPFAIKKEQLLDVMTKLSLPLPYAFNYHFDNGVFRGLAFANFTSTDETTAVVNLLNGREIGGRKLRVEYKKMLPLAERERIEREKREKRGQLEEQHRSTSNVSLASMISAASAPTGVITSSNTGGPTGSVSNANSVAGGSTAGANNPHQPQHLLNRPNGQTPSERFYAPIPFVNNLPIHPQQIDFNDAETLEFYSQLLFFRDDRDRAYSELAYPASLSANHKRIISILTGWLGLLESNDGSLILIKRRAALHDPSPLLRSQSHSAIPLLQSQLYNNNQQPQGSQQLPLQPQQAQLTGGQLPMTGSNLNLSQQSQPQQGQRFRNSNQNISLPQSPAQHHTSNSRIPPNFSLSGNQQSLSSAAILRNNPTPTRINSNNYYNNQQPSTNSQPGTPGFDSYSRFNLTSTTPTQPQQPLQPQLSGGLPPQQQQQQPSSTTSPFPPQGQLAQPVAGHGNQATWDSAENELNDGLNSLNLGLDTGSNIWGPRS